MDLKPEDDHEALLAAEAASDNVAREATWLCLRCESEFPGQDLFRDEMPLLGRGFHRRHTCPTCGSGRVVMPERVESLPPE